MCLILFALDTHPRYPLVLAGNRDEFYARPTHPAGWWSDAPAVLAGRDMRGGGTWMGVTREGRWAALSNFRDPGENRTDAPSRGGLVGGYLTGTESPEEYVTRLGRATEYAGFNLLVGDGGSGWWTSNRAEDAPLRLSAGVHGLSNHLLDTPWPKVERGKEQLSRLLSSPELTPDDLLDILRDRTLASDQQLPETGTPVELERALSAAFIATPEYGTRSSTALLMDESGLVRFAERTFQPGGREWTTVRDEYLATALSRPT